MQTLFNGHLPDIFSLVTGNHSFDQVYPNVFNTQLSNLLKQKEYKLTQADIVDLISKHSKVDHTECISFLPLHRLNTEQELQAVKSACDTVLSSGCFTSGEQVKKFEEEVALFLQASFCIGTSSGTDAIIVALRACGIEKGDEVILPSNSFAATDNAVFSVGAVPIYVDVADDFTISAQAIQKYITKKTKVILPVCLYGKLPDLATIHQLAKANDIKVITDAAQCFGHPDITLYSDLATLSFNPFKNFGVFGKGGAIISNNKELSSLCRNFSYHGFVYGKKNIKEQNFGFNARIDNIQASVAMAKAPFVCVNMLKRTFLAYQYIKLLTPVINSGKIKLPDFTSNNSWHLFPILLQQEIWVQQLCLFAKEKYQIELDKMYPILAHQQTTTFNKTTQQKYELGNTENLHKRLVHIPLHNHLSLQELNKIVDMLYDFLVKYNES